MRKTLVMLAVVVTGCAGQIINPRITDVDRSSSVVVRDLRPEAEKRAETFSFVITSDAYAIYRVADDAVTPPSTILLRHRAFEKLGGKTPAIDIHHFVTYRNLQSEFRTAGIAGGIGGAIGAVVVTQLPTTIPGSACTLVDRSAFEGLASAEFKRAQYSATENPESASVHVVYIDTNIGGRRVFTRTLLPLKTQTGDEPLVAALEAAVTCQLSQY